MQHRRDQMLSPVVLQRTSGGLLQSAGLCPASAKAFVGALDMGLGARLIVSYPEGEARKREG